jgi:ubiquinone biosynthesis protein COQ4
MATHRPFRPLTALRAMKRLLDDPEDTRQVFHIVRAIEGDTLARNFARFRDTPNGRRLLAERSSLLAVLSDRAALAAMPEGSLGRAYLRFCEARDLTADGLVAASEPEGDPDITDPDLVFLGERMRDQHDLWHVVTGFGPDLYGELGVLSFTVAQTGNPGIALIVAAGFLRSRGPLRRGREAVIRGLRQGIAAQWLPAAHWEALLERPLAEVRRGLGVVPVAAYEPVFADDPRYARPRPGSGAAAAKAA